MAIIIGGFSGCQTDANPSVHNDPPYGEDKFADYWYAGKAEVASYRLIQSRYGHLHEGHAVLIFVTEPFSKEKQVKLDNPSGSGNNELTVMKLNFTKKFNTGVYPYSMMLSAFTPVDTYHHPNTLKVSLSGQEWCGHVFSQMNLKKNNYEVRSFSYFEQEGDKQFEIDKKLLEDELWNTIRLNYKALPIGEIQIVPSLFFTRLAHEDLKPQKANASLDKDGENTTYTIKYPERELVITFQSSFPYQILSWRETYERLVGKMLTTSATLDKTLLTDYWNKNKPSDSYLRDSLNLD